MKKLTTKLFIEKSKFDDCKDKNTLRFDFYSTELNMCIEFDGIQHFKPIDFFGGAESFLSLKKRDQIKNNFCNNNNLKLIRVKYTDNILNILNKICVYM